MPYLLDADWTIEVLKGRQPATQDLQRLRGGGVLISRLTIAEIYEGAFRSSNPDARLAEMWQFLHTFEIVELDDRVARRFAELRAYLRRRGELIPDLDLFVAATALTLDLTLLTSNRRHFDRIPGLQLYPP